MAIYKWAAVCSLLFVSGCGGGGDDSSSSASNSTTLTTYNDYSITAIDGYLVDATAWLDKDKAGPTQRSSLAAITKSSGVATFKVPEDINAEDYAVFVQASAGKTFDEGLNRYVTNDFLMAAPPGTNVVTPFSTFVYFKTQSGMTIEQATKQLAMELQVKQEHLLLDFIKNNDERMISIAEDLVRLNLLPESGENFQQKLENSTKTNEELSRYAQIQSDPNDFLYVVRNSKNQMEVDTDQDGIADSDDLDIDGDGISNDEDSYPYEFDDHTASRPTTLLLSVPVSETITAGQWHYFKVETPEDILLNISLAGLSGDADLYVKQGSLPTKFDYDCRANSSYSLDEKCLQRLKTDQNHFIAVSAEEDTSYQILAKLDEIIVSKVTLLLHGLASSSETWQPLINDDSFYSGACQIIDLDSELVSLPDVNKRGEYCFSLDFGGYDRDTILSSKGLDGKTCVSALGCNGDYSSFELLGKEVEMTIGKIVDELGIDTEIVLIGHSRGGLAARAYLQNTASLNREHVKAMMTTGTPHQGSPLGRFYKYMDDNCTPKSSFRQDNSVCEDSWEVIEMLAGERKYFGFQFSDYVMDLMAPSIDFLSPGSEEVTIVNGGVLGLENIILSELTYSGTQFGVLALDATPRGNYDLYMYQQLLGGDHPHPSTLRYVENGATRASLVGDGIVPVDSQKLSQILAPYGRGVDFSLNNDKYNIVHIDQTKQVTDLFAMFQQVSESIGWGDTM
ncbi:alpha/beta fold hydrolase [Vibrio hyugaensis]|uniref:alpha/beta fold hydrolase n=1 Tax=Vibrio hyugaensis TaxID=1534743 RepID=UPI000CE3DDD6|nr:alpha/beta fold hydrolase [Vibrio hyugaensis]